ncbi:O-methyltransferase [Mycena polygramma]|nr:O-methyltransferase [Mycena polygramma]
MSLCLGFFRYSRCMDSLATLRALSDIISQAVTTVERKYRSAGLNPPALDVPFNPNDPAESLRLDPVVSEAFQNLVAASVSILNSAHAYQFQISSCVRAAAELNFAEILRDAGPGGAHVNDIAAHGQVDPKLVARILRLLATHHIFREVAVDVFANNRISSTMDKNNDANALFARPDERLLETNGLSALVEFISEEGFKASSYMTDALLDPKSTATGHMRAFRTSENMFQWFENPNNQQRLTRFAIAMQGTAAEEPEDTIFRGVVSKWEELPAGSIIVDVGGGLGASSHSIVKKYPQLKIVNQDRGPVIEQSKLHWKEVFPSHVEAGMVEFQAHNFLEPQPVTNAAAFLLRHVVHDWSDANVVIMLTHLRVAALPTTKLVIIDNIIASASGGVSANSEVNRIPILGAPRKPAAPPLLANFGMAAAPLYYYDLTVHNLLGGTERSLDGFYNVLMQSGWNLVEVYHCPQTDSSYVIADPVL